MPPGRCPGSVMKARFVPSAVFDFGWVAARRRAVVISYLALMEGPGMRRSAEQADWVQFSSPAQLCRVTRRWAVVVFAKGGVLTLDVSDAVGSLAVDGAGGLIGVRVDGAVTG